MKTIYSPLHGGHSPQSEFNRGRLAQPYERPERVDRIFQALSESPVGPIEAPAEFPLAHASRIHSAPFVDFLQGAYAAWSSDGRSGDALPITWPVRGFRDDRVPKSIVGQLSYYSFDGMTPITATTWSAVKAGMDVTLTAARQVADGAERKIFALCRPPGHHAASNYFGGYCFLNNAGIAAQYLLDRGASRVAILDVDYHHGNGTQEIFYGRKDVLYVSVHADPATDFPYFLGYSDETGSGDGAGFNLNIPLPQGTAWARWNEALESAKKAIQSFAPDVLILSFGADTHESDELSSFKLVTEDFLRMGESIAALGMPTVIVMEGGYGYSYLGANTRNLLTGFDSRG